MNNCIFCKIINNEIHSTKIYEDKDVLVILDVRPATKHGGHCLVMPKKHFELITDFPDKLLFKLIKIIKKMSKALLKYGEGLNILLNNKKVAGQAIPHVHFHLIPRFPNDGVLVEKWVSVEYKNDEAKKTATKIKSLLK
jgi:histidine triad (HIT) family protein